MTLLLRMFNATDAQQRNLKHFSCLVGKQSFLFCSHLIQQENLLWPAQQLSCSHQCQTENFCSAKYATASHYRRSRFD